MTEESKGGFWFLLVLFFFFLVYGLAKLVSNKNETLLFSILLSLYCIIFLLVTILPQNINYLFSLMSIRKFFPIFIVGLLVRKYENIISPWGYGMFIISFIIYMLMTYITYLLPEKSFSCMVLWSIGSVFGPIFYIDIFKRITILRSIFHFCGRYSLTIYIYHYIFMYILKLIVPSLWQFDTDDKNIIFINCSLFISAALITVACACWGYLNRNYKYKIYFGL